jgi:NhaC family Na+:H+ antiporter
VERKNPSLGFALLVLLIDAIIICIGVLPEDISEHFGGLGQGAQIPLLFACVVTAASGLYFLKIKWKEMEEGVFKTISTALQAMLILMIIGCLVGSWMQSGVAPTLIYYGLETLSPEYFLLAALFICCIVSISTGSSWSTSGTIGIALMGIAIGLEISAPVAAGFIISGAYFGDKMSPLSDTTNLAPAVAGSELFSHIGAMCWTTLPVIGLVAVIAVFMGRGTAGELDSSKIVLMQEIMKSEFTISWLCLIPPILVLSSAAMKIPAIPGIILGILSSVAISIFNGTDIGSIIGVLFDGYSPGLISEIGNAESAEVVLGLIEGTAISASSAPDRIIEIGKMMAELFTRGGMNSMMETIALILMALSLGGILESCGYLEVIISRLLETVKTTTGLIASVIVSCIFSNIFLADQYLGIVVPGRMFKSAFEKTEKKKKKMSTVMLSRSLEDAGTLTSVLVPWNTCGAYHTKVLNIETFAYLPYAFLNYLVPITALILTKLNIGMKWQEEKK